MMFSRAKANISFTSRKPSGAKIATQPHGDAIRNANSGRPTNRTARSQPERRPSARGRGVTNAIKPEATPARITSQPDIEIAKGCDSRGNPLPRGSSGRRSSAVAAVLSMAVISSAFGRVHWRITAGLSGEVLSED
jgi:hypothetical protein